ncbi:MAG: transglycosylase SLT domain-containing protein, partial [Gammaproteobacteria bacterium]|nr:transglycosylase SLT domain-containing protein [Gammaproteobacteria bacterium]
MPKLLTLLFLVQVFILSACSLSSSRDDVSIARQSSTDIESETHDLNIKVIPEKSKSNSYPATTEENEQLISQETDVWERIGSNLILTRNISEKTTASKLAWFARNQAYLDRVSGRAEPYLHYIVEELEKRNMPLDLALLPIVESAYNPFAYSRSRASGIWQFIPGTGRLYGLKQNWWYDGRRDIIAATDAALNYLQKLHQEFDRDWLLALAAYNSGEGNVGRAIRRNKKAGKPIDFFSLKLPRETRGYVPSLLAVAEIVANPNKYKIALKPINNIQHFKQVDIGSQIDLATAAELSELSIEELYT